MEEKPFYINSEDIDLFVRLVREAEEHHDGHLTIMRFPTNWRVMFGTPMSRVLIADAAVGQTFHQAGSVAIQHYRSIMTYRQKVVGEIVRRTGWAEIQASNTAGDVADMQEDGLSPEDAASEILLAAAEDS